MLSVLLQESKGPEVGQLFEGEREGVTEGVSVIEGLRDTEEDSVIDSEGDSVTEGVKEEMIEGVAMGEGHITRQLIKRP